MSKKQLVVLWVTALALISAFALINRSGSEEFEAETARKRGEPLFQAFPATQVAGIKIADGSEEVTLKRQAGGDWLIAEKDNFPADAKRVHEMLRQFAELVVTQGIAADQAYLPRFGMDHSATESRDHGLKLQFRDDSGEPLAAIYLGKESDENAAPANPFAPRQGGGGRFVHNPADQSGFYLVEERFPRIQASPDAWLDKTYPHPADITRIELSKEGQPEQTAWILRRESSEDTFKLADLKDDEAMNSTALTPLNNFLGYARFADIASEEQSQQFEQSDKARRLSLSTEAGVSYQIDFAPLEKAEGDSSSPAASGQQQFLAKLSIEGEPEPKAEPQDGESETPPDKQDTTGNDLEQLKQQLARERRLTGTLLVLDNYTLSSILKEREDFVEKKEAKPAAEEEAAKAAEKRKATATTPPIRIPAPPKPEEEATGESDDR